MWAIISIHKIKSRSDFVMIPLCKTELSCNFTYSTKSCLFNTVSGVSVLDGNMCKYVGLI